MITLNRWQQFRVNIGFLKRLTFNLKLDLSFNSGTVCSSTRHPSQAVTCTNSVWTWSCKSQVVAANGTTTDGRSLPFFLEAKWDFLAFGSWQCLTFFFKSPPSVWHVLFKLSSEVCTAKSTVGWTFSPLMIAFATFFNLRWEQILRHSQKCPPYSSLASGPLDLSRKQAGEDRKLTGLPWLGLLGTEQTRRWVYTKRCVPRGWTAGHEGGCRWEIKTVSVPLKWRNHAHGLIINALELLICAEYCFWHETAAIRLCLAISPPRATP